MNTKFKGLGRGLDALLGGAETTQTSDEQRALSVDRMQPGKYQPRTRMDAASLEELAASIRAQGIVQPILVRPVEGDRFEIVAGERRWRAAQLAGLKEVPVLIRQIADEAALAMALIENIQRENLNPLEEAMGLKRLIDEFGMTHQQAAEAVGRSRPAASNLLRLLDLAPPVQDQLLDGRIDMGHARALLSLPGSDQVALAQRIELKGLSVREAEQLVTHAQQARAERQQGAKPAGPSRDVLSLQEELADLLGAQVEIRTNRKGAGKLTVVFENLDQLDGILARLRSVES